MSNIKGHKVSKKTREKISDKIKKLHRKGIYGKKTIDKRKRTMKKRIEDGRFVSPWKGKFGKQSTSWKGGKYKDELGYVYVYDRKTQRYFCEHRVKMEKHLGRKLERWEDIHHKNKIKDDNRIENLEIVIHCNHFSTIRCPKCLYEFLIK